MIDFINNHLIPALILGSIYALGAIGISMVFAILRFADFAHGDLLTTGGYVALPLTAAGLNPALTIPVSMAATGALAILVDRLFYRPFRKSRPVIMVIASFGVALMIRAALLLTAGTQDAYYWGIQRPLAALAPLRLGMKHLVITVAVVLLISATYSPIGKLGYTFSLYKLFSHAMLRA
jgi:branched-subunit amino acid ABC-type transport system permease component